MHHVVPPAGTAAVRVAVGLVLTLGLTSAPPVVAAASSRTAVSNAGSSGTAATWACPVSTPLISAFDRNNPFGFGNGAMGAGDAVSDNGRIVAFATTAQLLPDHPLPGLGQTLVYVKDRRTGQLQAVGDEVTTDPQAEGPRLSGNGRWLAWADRGNVYVRDLRTGRDTQVVRALSPYDGTAPVGLSRDGRYLAFIAGRRDLTGAADGGRRVIVRNLRTGRNTVVPLPQPYDRNLNNLLLSFSMSEDGRHVGYVTMPPGGMFQLHAYVYDLRMHRLTDLTPAAPTPVGPYDDVRAIVLSRNGRYVAFASEDARPPAIFLRDMQEETTRLVSVLPDGSPAYEQGAFFVSGDGRYVLFGEGGSSTAYVRDVRQGTTSPLAIPGGPLPDLWELLPAAFSGDGHHAVLEVFLQVFGYPFSVPHVFDAQRCRS